MKIRIFTLFFRHVAHAHLTLRTTSRNPLRFAPGLASCWGNPGSVTVASVCRAPIKTMQVFKVSARDFRQMFIMFEYCHTNLILSSFFHQKTGVTGIENGLQRNQMKNILQRHLLSSSARY